MLVNIVHEELSEQMNNASVDFSHDVSEFIEVGLTLKQTKVIKGVCVEESLVQFECKVHTIKPVGSNHMVIGEVVHLSINDRVYLGNFKIDVNALNPTARLAGN